MKKVVVPLALLLALVLGLAAVGCTQDAGPASPPRVAPTGGSGAAATGVAPTGGLDAAVDGSSVFANNCTRCHGRTAPPAAQLGRLSESQIRSTVTNGKGHMMPAWRGYLSTEEISAVARFLKQG